MMCLALSLKIWTKSNPLCTNSVIDHQLQGIEICLRDSHHKFPIRNDKEGWIEIVRAFDYPNTVPLNRCADFYLLIWLALMFGLSRLTVMALKDSGIKKRHSLIW